VSAADNLNGSIHKNLQQRSIILIDRRRTPYRIWVIGFNVLSTSNREWEDTKVRMGLCFSSGQTVLMVVAKELVQEINGFVRDVPLVLRSDESSPRFPWIPARRDKLNGGIVS